MPTPQANASGAGGVPPKMPPSVRNAQVLSSVLGLLVLLNLVTEVFSASRPRPLWLAVLVSLPLLALLVLALLYRPGRNSVRVGANVCLGLHVCLGLAVLVARTSPFSGVLALLAGVVLGVELNRAPSVAWFRRPDAR
jgi:hypothetical protein